MNQINLNSRDQTATMVKNGEIVTLGYDEIKLSELVNFEPQEWDSASFKSFSTYHDANPWVMNLLRKKALRLKRKGLNKFSMKGLFEIVRYQYAVKTGESPRKLKLNNNHTAFYSRALMAIEPRLYGFFEIRKQKI